MRPSTVFPAAMTLAAVTLAGCDSLFKPDVVVPPNRELLVSIQTEDLVYTLVETREGWLEATIHYALTNLTSEPISLVNCGGTTAATLEKLVTGEWIEFWQGATFACLSPPITIDAGEVMQRTLDLFGGLSGCGCGPRFATDDVEGTYRIVLGRIVHRYDEDLPSFGQALPKPQRTSNAFVLRR